MALFVYWKLKKYVYSVRCACLSRSAGKDQRDCVLIVYIKRRRINPTDWD